MTLPPPLFDRRLVRRSRQRALTNPRDFLGELIVEEMTDRLAMITRPLETMVIHGASTAALKAAARAQRPKAAILSSDVISSPGSDLVFDEENLPFAPESLNAFVHILGLERTNDVPGALVQIRRALKPDGLFLAAVLGGDTLSELKNAWLNAETAILGGTTPRVAPFIHVREWGSLLQRAGFALPVIDADRRTIRYRDLIALMHDLRGLGLNNALVQRTRKPLTRSLLSRLSYAYSNRYGNADGKLNATFEIIYLTAWAPHESQQKPLRPGSAAMRLADALGTSERKLETE